MGRLPSRGGRRPEFGTVLDNPDFAAVATAMGITGIRVTDPDEIAVPAMCGRRR
ncbi:thiamine pyrophosphate-dependent enzyme [Streptomyces sp. NPDC048504]|uniref:thiamine pyrophosphate-dependent enzyme n=1 Tax=Streptomyces sp. NPDC048504 TaxID=3365559 RepID=UPI00371AC197